MKELLISLKDFQSEIKPLIKDVQGHGYQYADLTQLNATIKPILDKYGLFVTTIVDNNNMIATLHHLATEQTLSSSLELPLSDLEYKEVEKNGEIKLQIPGFAGMNKAQAYGSLLTYFRRYSKSVLLDLISESDTDGVGKEKSTYVKKEFSDLNPDGNKKTWLNEKQLTEVVKNAKEKGIELSKMRDWFMIGKDVYAKLEKLM
jgi:hypothetical protein